MRQAVIFGIILLSWKCYQKSVMFKKNEIVCLVVESSLLLKYLCMFKIEVFFLTNYTNFALLKFTKYWQRSIFPCKTKTYIILHTQHLFSSLKKIYGFLLVYLTFLIRQNILKKLLNVCNYKQIYFFLHFIIEHIFYFY